MKNKKSIVLALLILVIFLFPIFFQKQTKAQIVCESTDTTVCIPSSASTGLPDPGDDGVLTVIENLAKWLLGLFGVVAIIGFVISGFQYITAAGGEKTIETAKRNMTYSIIGIIVALSGLVVIQAVDAALRATSPNF